MGQNAAPNARIFYLKGNHEARFQRFLWRQAPELASLPALTVPKLLSLDDVNITWVGDGSMMFHTATW